MVAGRDEFSFLFVGVHDLNSGATENSIRDWQSFQSKHEQITYFWAIYYKSLNLT